jgi:hypothetical protein
MAALTLAGDAAGSQRGDLAVAEPSLAEDLRAVLAQARRRMVAALAAERCARLPLA